MVNGSLHFINLTRFKNIAMMAYSTDSNATLIEQWANSPGHRSNMLSSMYSRTGFARDGRYAVQIF
ncbi:MAG: CAP domain-containing protein, partial [bacterium]